MSNVANITGESDGRHALGEPMEPPNDEEREAVLALLAVRFLLPDAHWRLATVDGVRVIFARSSEIAASARTELAKVESGEDDGG